MIRNLLVIEVPHASDKGMVTILLRPIDCFFLRFEGTEHVVVIGFDHIIVHVRSFRAALGAGFYVNVRHHTARRILPFRATWIRYLSGGEWIAEVGSVLCRFAGWSRTSVLR
jgi:hypothetical protein